MSTRTGRARTAARTGIPVAELARAMRAAGADRQLTEAEVTGWTREPDTAPEWFTELVGERLARAAQAEYCRQTVEQQQLREQSAWAKVRAGKRRFTDEWMFVQDWAFQAAKDLVRGGPGVDVTAEERQVLRAVGVDADDHATWPMHAGGCDGVGREHCAVRIEQMRAQWRVDALIESVAKETALRGLALTPGQFVTTWHGARVGQVVRVNKVSVKVRLVGGKDDRYAVVEKNLDPRYVRIASPPLGCPPAPGDLVTLRDHGGYLRQTQVVAVDDPLFEATYSLESGQWRSAWFDLTALVESTAGSPCRSERLGRG